MGSVVPAANALGTSQEELFNVFATLTGVTGNAAEVSTQLGSIFTALMKPSGEMTKTLKKMGFESGFAAMKSLGLQGTLKGLVEATGGSDEALVQLAGRKEAVTAMLALTGSQADTFSEKLGKLQNAAGATDRAFAAQTEGVAKSGFIFQQAMVKMQVAAQQFGDSAAPFIEKGADAVSGLGDWLKSLDEKEQKNLINVGVGLAALGPGLSILSKGITVFNGAKAALGGLAGAAGAKGVIGSLGGVAAAAGPAIGIIAALTGGVALATAALKKSEKEARNYGESLADSEKVMQDQIKAAKDLNTVLADREKYSAAAKSEKSSIEEVNDAQNKLKETTQWLIDNYVSYLSTESLKTGIISDADIARLKEALELKKQIAIADQKKNISETKPEYDAGKITYAEKSQQRDNLVNDNQHLEKTIEIIGRYQSMGSKTNETLSQMKQELNGIGVETSTLGDGLEGWERADQILNSSKTGFENNTNAINGLNSELDEISTHEANFRERTRAIEDTMISELPEAMKKGGAAVKDAIAEIGRYGQDADLSFQEMGIYAQEAAARLNGFGSVQEAIAAGGEGLDATADNCAETMSKWGYSAQAASIQGALLKNGFQSLGQAAEDGKLDVVAQQATELGQKLGIIPKDTSIKINADGNGYALVKDTAEATDDLDGKEANVGVNAEDGASDIINGTDQKISDLNGQSAELTVSADGSQAYATINGVQYQVVSYDQMSGNAILSADGSSAAMSINFATGQVQTFGAQEGEAVLDAIDNASQKARDAAGAISNIKDRKVTITAVFQSIGDKVKNFLGFAATGIDNSPGGLAIVNDEKRTDPREMLEREGKLYLIHGKNVPIQTQPGDKIYTARQREQIMKDMGIPHYASGKNNSSYDKKKAAFQHRQKTSEVSVLEELEWWKELQRTMKLAQEDAEDVEENIYKLTKQLNDDSVKDYKERISEQVSDGERWLNWQVKINHISYDDQIAILQRIDDRYRATLDEMLENTQMTEEEKEEVYKEYYKKHQDLVLDMADLEIKKAKEVKEAKQKIYDELMEDSEAYVSDRNFYNDWSDYGDTPLEAWGRVRDRINGEIENETDPERIKELQQELKDFGTTMYEDRREDSRRWMETEEHYGNLTLQGRIDALERQRAYTKQYYQWGIIKDHKKYVEEMADLDEQYFDTVKEQLETAVNEYYEAQREELDIKRKRIQDEYDLEDEAEEKEDQDAKLAKLRKEEAMWAGAVTIEGKKKLQDIRDEIKDIEDQQRKAAREKEKQARLDEIDSENDDLDKKEKEALAGVSKYAQEAAGVMDKSNAEAANAFNGLMQQYTAQQEQIAKTGAANIGNIVNWTMKKLQSLNEAEAQAKQKAAQASGQTVNNNNTTTNYTLNQTNNNIVQDRTDGEALGLAAGRSFQSLG